MSAVQSRLCPPFFQPLSERPRRAVTELSPRLSPSLEWLLGRVGGDLRKAIAAYNWGIGHVMCVVQERGEQWEAALPLETSGYLARILGA